MEFDEAVKIAKRNKDSTVIRDKSGSFIVKLAGEKMIGTCHQETPETIKTSDISPETELHKEIEELKNQLEKG